MHAFDQFYVTRRNSGEVAALTEQSTSTGTSVYIPQLFETISQPIHAERIANAEHQRNVSARVDEYSSLPASIGNAFLYRLAGAVEIVARRVRGRAAYHSSDS
jgi:hypothetical protein